VYNSYLSDSGSSCVPYGGYSGNVLFSRYPLKNATTQSLVYPLAAHLFNSDAILAVSSFSGLGDVNLYALPPPYPSIHHVRLPAL
jgi:hypothetical protein